MKTAVVFYSLDGNCALVARQLKSILNADLVELQLQNAKKPRGFAKMLWGVCMVLMKKKPPLKPYTFDPSAYELIIIGAPVWASTPASPIQTFISEAHITGKKIALFVCHAGGQGDVFKKFSALLPENEIITTTDFNNPAKGDIEKLQQQVADWVKGFAAD